MARKDCYGIKANQNTLQSVYVIPIAGKFKPSRAVLRVVGHVLGRKVRPLVIKPLWRLIVKLNCFQLFTIYPFATIGFMVEVS